MAFMAIYGIYLICHKSTYLIPFVYIVYIYILLLLFIYMSLRHTPLSTPLSGGVMGGVKISNYYSHNAINAINS